MKRIQIIELDKMLIRIRHDDGQNTIRRIKSYYVNHKIPAKIIIKILKERNNMDERRKK